MAAKYTRLPTEDRGDSVAFDFSSCTDYSSYNTYGSSRYGPEKFKSIFSYGDPDAKMADHSISVVTESLLSRVCRRIITFLCLIICIITFPVSAFFVIKIVPEDERLVVFRLGRLQGVRKPGVNIIVPCVDRVKKVDVRIKAFNVPPLQLITQDAGIIELGADVYYKVTDAVRSVAAVQDLNTSLRGLVRNSLMNTLTKHDLQSIEERKEELIGNMQATCNNTAMTWGVQIDRVQLSPIKVLQAAPQGASIPGMGGQEGLTQVFQHLASAFMAPGGGIPGMMPQLSPLESGDTAGMEASGAEGPVAIEDVRLESSITPAALVEIVRGVLSESLVHSVGASYQFELSGPSGGVFFLDLKHGSGSVGVGPDPQSNPDVTLQLSVSTMRQMVSGNLKPLSAYMSGGLKVSGDLSAATRLEEVMERIVSKSNSVSSVAGHTVVNI